MNNKDRILQYLRQYLRDPAIAKIETLDDRVFDQAIRSTEIVRLDIAGQVEYWCQRPSFWNASFPSPSQNLRQRRDAMARAVLYDHLFRTLLGRSPDSQPIAKMFGTHRSAKGILGSDNPEVIKLREHLGPAMIILELVGIQTIRLPIQASPPPASKDEVLQLLKTDDEMSQLLSELCDFKRSLCVPGN